MIQRLARLIAVVSLSAAAPFAAAQETASFPKDWKTWTHVTTTVVMNDEHPAHGIRQIYVNDKGSEAAISGAKEFPDGSAFVLVRYDIRAREIPGPKGIKSDKLFMNKRKQIDLMVKDTAKYPQTGGWNYARFRLPDETLVEKANYARCFECHNKRVKDKDFVFTRVPQ